MRLILASASPRRAELLRAAGYTFEVRTADVDEAVLPGESPRDYVVRLAAEKASAVHTQMNATGVLIIGADTTVVVDDEILVKPADEADAERMLRRMSGRSHRVLTGVSVRGGQRQVTAADETAVFMRPLTEEDVRWYVDSGEGRDKAGGYAIQGLASRFIPRIEGSYSNVVGLPVALVAQLMVEVGGNAGR
ncbi:MAG: septum formation inhibitor Maf [Acidobacteria bacterium]|nr:septum formation inhibitor Maf [Acidobacteriota bacterium]